MASEVSLEALMDCEVEAFLATVSASERLIKLEKFQNRKKLTDSYPGKHSHAE